MVQQVTQGIRVSIETEYQGTFYRSNKLYYAFNYTVTIENQGKDTVQLLARHWRINDSLNHKEIVDGEGVVGEKPILKPGTTHKYSSSCFLISPYGSMRGYYQLVNFTTTSKFKVIIPIFRLSAPFALN